MTARILYFGSRSWIDVPDGWEHDDVHGVMRRERRIVEMGPCATTINRQMIDDVRALGALVVIEGEANGADLTARIFAGLLGQSVERYPVDTVKDGPWRHAGQRRNARMAREGKPTHARGFISGKRGTPLSRGSAGMLRILLAKDVPIIVHREDGIDPMRIADLRVRP